MSFRSRWRCIAVASLTFAAAVVGGVIWVRKGFPTHTVLTWLSDPLAPAWAQAIFAGLAIIGAVLITAWQRSSAQADWRREQARQEKEHLRRLTVGLRAEIEAALQAARAQQEGLDQTLRQLADARDHGIAIATSGPIHPGSMAVTDAIVYRQIAGDLGRLPSEIIKWLVPFYAQALQRGRLADAAPQAVEAYKILSDSGSRLRLNAALVLRTLDKFEAAGFLVDADIRPTQEEIQELAAKTGYPLGEVARERGLKV
jgi:hypothetical protein